MSHTQLALLGGTPALAPDTIRPWPPITDLDRSMVLASLDGGQHALGPNCRALNGEFAAWNGNRFGVNANSGTAALHMAVAACGVGAGDEVIVTAYSWSSSATCILQHNAIPVFVDIEFDTMNLDPAKLEAALTPRTKAIVVVHLHGLPVDMDAVLALARPRGIKVIEDCCQAHGARWRGAKVGTLGDCGAFSFNQNKMLSAGEGGMLVTDDEQLSRDAAAISLFGETREPEQGRDYHAYALGWMYRNSDLGAAFARAQLTRLDSYISTASENAAALTAGLRDVPGLLLPTEPAGATHNWYNYTLRFDPAVLGERSQWSSRRFAIQRALNAEGVPCHVWQHFILPAMTVFQAKNAYGKGCPWHCPHAGEVDYTPANFPAALDHCDSHTGMTYPLRPPHGVEVAQRIATAFEKVMTQLDALPEH